MDEWSDDARSGSNVVVKATLRSPGSRWRGFIVAIVAPLPRTPFSPGNGLIRPVDRPPSIERAVGGPMEFAAQHSKAELRTTANAGCGILRSAHV